jgi:hypothetical protein
MPMPYWLLVACIRLGVYVIVALRFFSGEALGFGARRRLESVLGGMDEAGNMDEGLVDTGYTCICIECLVNK